MIWNTPANLHRNYWKIKESRFRNGLVKVQNSSQLRCCWKTWTKLRGCECPTQLLTNFYTYPCIPCSCCCISGGFAINCIAVLHLVEHEWNEGGVSGSGMGFWRWELSPKAQNQWINNWLSLVVWQEALQKIRQKNTMRREVTVELSSQGFWKTGIRSDVCQVTPP